MAITEFIKRSALFKAASVRARGSEAVALYPIPLVEPPHPQALPVRQAARHAAVRAPYAFRVQPAFHSYVPSPEGDGTGWIALGKSVEIGKATISGGMIYVGWPSVSPGSFQPGFVAPLDLVNPKLPLSERHDLVGCLLPPRLSYQAMDPSCRRAYLLWLSGGRDLRGVAQGYPLLYLLGLERRLLLDSPNRAEVELLLAEVERVAAAYPELATVRARAFALLDICTAKAALEDVSKLASFKPDPHAALAGAIRLPTLAKLSVARKVAQGEALDFETAFQALASSSPAMGHSFRNRLSRSAANEFIQLCRLRFSASHPTGLIVRDRRSSSLSVEYPVGNLLSVKLIKSFDGMNWPDPRDLKWMRMDELCEEADRDLSNYVLAISMSRVARGSAAAAAYLPKELSETTDALRDLRNWLDATVGAMAAVDPVELAARCIGDVKRPPSQRDFQEIWIVLRAVGYGMEPDPPTVQIRMKGLGRIHVFREDDPRHPGVRGVDFAVARLLASALASLGDAELAAASFAALSASMSLAEPDRIRLRAVLESASARKPKPADLKRMACALSVADTERLAWTVASLANGLPHAVSVAIEKLFDAMGVARSVLYGTMHAAAGRRSDVGPVQVSMPEAHRAKGFAIPKPPAKEPAGVGPVLDMARLGEIAEETKRVSRLLSAIYADEDETLPAVGPEADGAVARADSPVARYVGLEREHARLAERLTERSSWSRDEYEAMAREAGLMPDGALETMNEWAEDRFGSEFASDRGDILEMDATALAAIGSEPR